MFHLSEKFLVFSHIHASFFFSTFSVGQSVPKVSVEILPCIVSPQQMPSVQIFFRIFFEVSGKSHSAEKCKSGTLWDFLNIHSVAKYQKLMGGTIKKFRKKSVSHCRKNDESLIVSKKVDPSALEWRFISC